MRIGIIAPPWLPVPPGRYGGTENMIDGLARGLAHQGHDVTLVAPMGSRCKVHTIPLPVSHHTERGLGHALVEVPYALRAYETLGEARVDVIHDHTQVGFLLTDSCAIWDEPIITTNHNLFDAERQRIYDEAVARGVKVVAISKHHASTAGGLSIAGVVHNGIDVDNIPVGQGDGGYACVLSRMSRDKGLREAILIARRVGIPVHVAAKMQTTQEHQYYKDQIHDLVDGENVIFRGELSARGKYQMLGGAVALLNPIQWDEPFGLAMVEALACGTPVLSTLRGAAPEIVDHGTTGWLRNQWEMLAADLERAHTLDRAACRRAAEQRFSIDRMASEYLELYGALQEEKAA